MKYHVTDNRLSRFMLCMLFRGTRYTLKLLTNHIQALPHSTPGSHVISLVCHWLYAPKRRVIGSWAGGYLMRMADSNEG